MDKSMTESASRKRPKLIGLFTDHPASVGESYGEHFLFAGRFSARLMGASLAAAAHAIFPFAFKTTASQQIARMYAATSGRKPDAVDATIDTAVDPAAKRDDKTGQNLRTAPAADWVI